MNRDLFERHAVVRLLVYAAAVIAALYAANMIWSVVAHYGNIILVLFLAWVIAFVLQPLATRRPPGACADREMAPRPA